MVANTNVNTIVHTPLSIKLDVQPTPSTTLNPNPNSNTHQVQLQPQVNDKLISFHMVVIEIILCVLVISVFLLCYILYIINMNLNNVTCNQMIK
mgnify:CR=1 FL=1